MSLDTNYPHVKFAASKDAPMASSPRILNRQAPSDAEAMQKAPVAVHHRSANLIAGDGTKKALFRSEQRSDDKPKQLLDRKSPIQVRIQLSPAGSRVTPGLERPLFAGQLPSVVAFRGRQRRD